MAGIFRKKKKVDDDLPKSPVSPIFEKSNNVNTESPIYARFASKPQTPQKVAVSGPMLLSARRESFSKPAASAPRSVSHAVRREEREQQVEKALPVPGNSQQPVLGAVVSGSTTSLTSNRNPSNSRDKPLVPVPASTPTQRLPSSSRPPSSPSAKRASLMGKPLPPSSPPDSAEDILSSRPPQSQLPMSRRISSSSSGTRSTGQDPIRPSSSRANNHAPVAAISASSSTPNESLYSNPKSRPSYRRPNADQPTLTPSSSQDANQSRPVRNRESIHGKDAFSSVDRAPVKMSLEDTTSFSGPIRDLSASLQVSPSQKSPPAERSLPSPSPSDQAPDTGYNDTFSTNMGAVNSALAHSSSKRVPSIKDIPMASSTSVLDEFTPVPPPTQPPQPQIADRNSSSLTPAQFQHSPSMSRTSAPTRGKPLIFAAMMVEQPDLPKPQVSGYMNRHEPKPGPAQNGYPSPPPENPLSQSRTQRSGPPISFNHPDAVAIDKQSRRRSLTKPVPPIPPQNWNANANAQNQSQSNQQVSGPSRPSDSMAAAPPQLQTGFLEHNVNANIDPRISQYHHVQNQNQRNVLHSHRNKPSPPSPSPSSQQQQQQQRISSVTHGSSSPMSLSQPLAMMNGRVMSGVDGAPGHGHPDATNPNTSPHINGSKPHRTLTKQRPTTPNKHRPVTPDKSLKISKGAGQQLGMGTGLGLESSGIGMGLGMGMGSMDSGIRDRDRDSVGRSVAIPLEDDPFARVEGVTMMKPSPSEEPPPLPSKDEKERMGSRDGLSSRDGASTRGRKLSSRDGLSTRDVQSMSSLQPPDPPLSEPAVHSGMGGQVGNDWDAWVKEQAVAEGAKNVKEEPEPATVPSAPEEMPALAQAHVEEVRSVTPPPLRSNGVPQTPPTPEEYRSARSRRRGGALEKPPAMIDEVKVRLDRPAEPFPLELLVCEPNLLEALLSYLSFFDWCNLTSLNKKTRSILLESDSLRENILERFLRTVGYTRWVWPEKEPLSLSLTDLHDYMRGVSLPTHQYPRIAELYLQQHNIHPSKRDAEIDTSARQLMNATRAYNRVLLRLRAQAEKEPNSLSSSTNVSRPSPPLPGRSSGDASPRYPSRPSSRAPSPTQSNYSHSHHGHVLRGRESHSQMRQAPSVQASQPRGFNSPLFRLRRAPLLRVFVPSPDGDWLSDASVLECEAELKRAGLLKLMRMGDVVWDMAVGDEGNIGRLVWDGKYLIDLDYTFSTIGDLPKYIPALAFPPSYFHRVVRTGPSLNNPVIRIDLSPWGEEIAANLQLVQDRVRTETPQGTYHNVVRWIHRSRFTIRASNASRRSQSQTRGSVKSGQSPSGQIPIPNSNGLFVDPGWYGTIVVETEGTNESLADLQDRCGPGVFPPRVQPSIATLKNPQTVAKEQDAKLVFRILRERSRPGEIWIRAVSPKEQLR